MKPGATPGRHPAHASRSFQSSTAPQVGGKLCKLMAFIPLVNTAQVSMVFSQADGSFAENVLYVENTDPWSPTTLGTTADAVADWFSTGDGAGHSYKAGMSNVCSLVDVIARDMTTQTGDVVHTSVSMPIVGGSGNGPIELGLSFTLTERTGLAGRSQRGRVFLIGMETDWVSDGHLNQIDATHAADAVLAWTALIGILGGAAGIGWVVASRYHNNAPRDTGEMTLITSVGFHNLLVDFQRRRAPAHNRHH